MNIGLKKYKAHTEPIFKDLEILKITDKFKRIMHQYRHEKHPASGFWPYLPCSGMQLKK